MRLLFDQNISFRILKLNTNLFFESSTIKKEKLINSSDREIWEFAKKNHYTIVTQDSDFNDLNLLLGFPPKIIWIRSGNQNTQSISDLIAEYSFEITRFILDENYGCFEIFSSPKK
jgi:predicted nuclease of predicted toxin-antitoxin system